MLNLSLNFPGKEIKVFFSFTQAGDLNGNPKPSIEIYSGVSKNKTDILKVLQCICTQIKSIWKIGKKNWETTDYEFKFDVNSLIELPT